MINDKYNEERNFVSLTTDIFEEWENKYIDRSFVFDGIVDENEWDKQEIKICFLLKEAYTKDKKNYFKWSLSKWLNRDESSVINTWNTVALWTYGILNTTESNIPEYPDLNLYNRDEKHNILKKISAVNVKKVDGVKKSDWYDLKNYAEKDKELLRKQIDRINPDIIICGKTFDFLRIIYGASYDETKKCVDDKGEIKNSDKGYVVFTNIKTKKKTIVIDYYHPANQFPSKVNFYALCALYQQALKSDDFNRP